MLYVLFPKKLPLAAYSITLLNFDLSECSTYLFQSWHLTWEKHMKSCLFNAIFCVKGHDHNWEILKK